MKYVMALILMIPTAAMAQSAYVPFTVTEQDARNLRAYLDEQQLKVGLPILQWMDALEQKAVKAAAEKSAEDKKDK